MSRTHGVWSSSTVLRMLEDQRYIGTYVIGKRKVQEIGSRRMKLKDESEWFKIPDHHPAIVSMELFEKANASIRRFSLPNKKRRNYLLRGKVFCGCCDHAMSLRNGTLFIRLVYAADTNIIRFTKIRSCSNPFDADDQEYFEKRDTEKMRNSLKGRKILAKLFRQQNGLCPVCGKKITVDTGFQVYDDKGNRQNHKQMLHPECYRKVRKNDVSFEPVPEGEL